MKLTEKGLMYRNKGGEQNDLKEKKAVETRGHKMS